MCISFSKILSKFDKIDMGQQIETISFESFLWKGITSAIFKESRKTPVLKDKLNICTTYWDISFWVSLSISGGILLGPVDLLLFREKIIASISC